MKYFKFFIVFIIFDNTVRGNVDFDDEYVDSILDNYDVCEDSNKECEHWSSIGECDKNPSYMKTNCKVSCNTCDAGPDELKIPRLPKGKYSVCENYHEYCKMWSSVGECEKNPGYMHGNCKFSCKLCTPVSAPIIPPIEFSCGYEYILGFYYGKLNDGREVPAYFINQTKTKLEEQGHRTEVLDMIGDAISELKTCFKSKCHTYKFDGFFGVAPAGGKPAEKERAQYMAKIGVKDGDKIIFYCDGVVINRKWILSAAHCFFKSVNLNVVRMGDYDGSRVNRKTTLKYEFLTVDYPIDKVVFYPDYDIKERYHDLALIRLPQKTPEYASTIVPICLPWKYNNEDFEGKKVVLTGWGATAFGGTRTKVLQQVGLKVVSPLVCQKSYSKLPGFEKKHPYGLNYNNIMCVGADEVGKDACNGDSGGPLVLGLGETGKSEHFVLAGIVSGGFGCGLKEYPGLYIPINKDRYLRWIKEVAFKDFQ